MRIRKDRPNSAQPPKNANAPNNPTPSALMSPVSAGGVPTRAMSYSGKRPAAAAQAQEASRDYSSLSQSYMSAGSKPRPPINPDLHKLKQSEWTDTCEGVWFAIQWLL